ncbi:MAG: flippase-like domain-containing protein [Nannocystaceae bacterium]|nr:flippase-like domain-containing protein [Nannocystaceae bacterium]
MSTLLRRTLYTLVAGVLLYVAAILYPDIGPVRETLRGYRWQAFGMALLLSSGNYLLRFAKWEIALSWLKVREQAPGLTRKRSLVIYLAGLSMSITPGKVGEVLRSTLLKASDGVPFTKTAPIVVADRLTDLVALVVLSLAGVAQYPDYVPLMLATMVLVILGVVVLGSPRLLRGTLRLIARVPGLRGLTERAAPLVDSSAAILDIRPLAALTALSIVGWGLECVGFWLILQGFAGVEATLPLCAFLWSAGTLVGALSFLPGGLGATEGSLMYATMRLVAGATQPIAMAAALLGRLATLWYGELVGGIALAIFLRDPAVRQRAMHND